MRPTIDSFRATLQASAPPDLPPPLRALWLDAKGDWDGAHKCVDSLSDPDSCWAHAYLHRKEGDLWNAAYWYRRAGRTTHEGALAEEWAEIVISLLAKARE